MVKDTRPNEDAAKFGCNSEVKSGEIGSATFFDII